MNIRRTKKPEARVDVRYLSNYGIKTYGLNNLYPQEVSDVIDASSTGSECLARYVRFIEGCGFNDLEFSEKEVNRRHETADDLCKACAEDLARYNGFALHVNYNVFGEITEVQNVPFEQCRLAEDDDSGYIGYIYVHPDWRGRKTRNGRTLRVTSDTIKKFDVFNPRKEVVLAQIQAAGTIDAYKGQILYVSGGKPMTYPKPKYDAAITELSTDEALSNVKYRNARNNFLVSCILTTRRSQSLDNEHGDDFDSGYSEAVEQFAGDEQACNIMEIALDTNEEAPTITEFPVKNFDKDFTATESSCVERIYSIFEQEPFLSIRNGKLGFSGDVIQDAYNYYSAICGREQRIIERAFTAVFSRWAEPVGEDFSINPLVFQSTNTSEGGETQLNDTTQKSE